MLKVESIFGAISEEYALGTSDKIFCDTKEQCFIVPLSEYQKCGGEVVPSTNPRFREREK